MQITVYFWTVFLLISGLGKKCFERLSVNSTRSTCIQTSKCLFKNVVRIGSVEFISKKSQEHRKIDVRWRFFYHTANVVFRDILFSESVKHVQQIFFIDKPIAVLVNHFKNLLQLQYLIFVEHWEHVWSSSLFTHFVSYLFCFTSFTRHKCRSHILTLNWSQTTTSETR